MNTPAWQKIKCQLMSTWLSLSYVGDLTYVFEFLLSLTVILFPWVYNGPFLE